MCVLLDKQQLGLVQWKETEYICQNHIDKISYNFYNKEVER